MLVGSKGVDTPTSLCTRKRNIKINLIFILRAAGAAAAGCWPGMLWVQLCSSIFLFFFFNALTLYQGILCQMRYGLPVAIFAVCHLGVWLSPAAGAEPPSESQWGGRGVRTPACFETPFHLTAGGDVDRAKRSPVPRWKRGGDAECVSAWRPPP